MKEPRLVRLSDFEHQQETGIWVPPGSGRTGPAFSYSDGDDEETRVLNAVSAAADSSDNTGALLPFVTDWPSYYHLAPGRSNAVRALGLPRDLDILELGAGCGAMARHLGENHTSVHSVEGSARRAAICRTRCRDLPNVRVFQADFSAVQFDAAYDVVLLNGVLEYAPAFFPVGPGSDPVDALLQLAKSALRPGGVVLIAIENKLGLKYWCGAPEDHTATNYEGIHGYPATTRVRTFSRREVRQIISAAGFPAASVFYCFPDYKFASTVLSDQLPENTYLHNWLDFPAECPGLGRDYSIHEGLAGKSLYEAGLLGEFANSFLVVAGTDGAPERFPGLFKPAWVAKRLSVRGRDKTHHRVTTLAGVDGQLVVTKAAVAYREAPALPPPHVVPWTPGELVLFDMSRAMLGSHSEESVHALLTEYHDALLARFALNQRDSDHYPLLHGRCMDFLMRNLIRSPDGLVAIDLEWEAPQAVPVDFMLFRSLWNDAIAPNHAWASRNIPDFDGYIVHAIRRFYAGYGFARQAQNRAREHGFLAGVGADESASAGRGDAALVMVGKAWGRAVTRRLRNKFRRS